MNHVPEAEASSAAAVDVARASRRPWVTTSNLARLFMWLCLAVLAFSLSARRASEIAMDDDNLYLAYAAQGQRTAAKDLEQRLIDRVAAVPACEESAFRLAFRKRYATNYSGYAAVQGAVQDVASRWVPAGTKSVVFATLAAKGLFLLLLPLALLVAATRGPSREVGAAAVCAYLVLVALDVVPPWKAAPQRVDIEHLLQTTLQQLSSMFVIARPHSYFEVTPRNGALLVFAISLVLKWQGRLTAAAVTLLGVALLHQTYGGIGLILFTIVSAVSRPEVFAARVRQGILVGVGLLYVMRENFWQRLDVWIQVAAAAGLVLAAWLFFRVMGSARFAALRKRCLGRWAEREVVVDAGALVAFIALVTLGSWAADQLMQDPITRRYVWANLPIRTLSFVRFPAFIALFWVLLNRTQWLARPMRRSWLAAFCGLGCLALGSACATKVDLHAWKRLRSQMERNLDRPREGRTFSPTAEENRIYAHLVMVAAGQLEPDVAEKRIVAKRKISCQRTRQRAR